MLSQPTASSRLTVIGRITLLCTAEHICALQLPCCAAPAPPPSPDTTADAAFRQLDEYLAGQRHRFELPLLLRGQSERARRILQAIAEIPYGHTATYGSLGPARAVGQVCAANPLPLFIPCHRVLPLQHPPGHYRGGRELKAWLLSLESGLFPPSAASVPRPG